MMHLIQLPPLHIKGKTPGTWLGKSRTLLTEDLEEMGSDALAAVRAAQRKPIPLGAEQEARFHTMRRTGCIAVYRTERKLRGRAKKLIYRRGGKGGADMEMSPVLWDQAQARAAVRVRLYEAFKQPPPPEAGVSARQAIALARASRVLALIPKYRARGRDCGGLIARQLGEPIAYVRRILREERSRPTLPIL
ncbi:hypothetical protein [Pseudoxanthomonas sacheonensis]|uniref:hypothetical protein n=1 Tax=Pseudoxanthomonas sacheonensis TaxID=443615 RepID=UPI0013D0A16B|nr:hypothetical protein [Pseudoxanthomonas sacheonensis]